MVRHSVWFCRLSDVYHAGCGLYRKIGVGLLYLYFNDRDLYGDHHSLYFHDWGHYRRPAGEAECQWLPVCDDQNCGVPGDHCRAANGGMAWSGQQGTWLSTIDGLDGCDGSGAVHLLLYDHP
ncbi:hypothetical protein D3C80_1541340 [compost metagenome]